jgi:hypothetical protein
MINLRVVTTADGHGTPPCPECANAECVRPVIVRSVKPGVRYWGCERCGVVWGVILKLPC